MLKFVVQTSAVVFTIGAIAVGVLVSTDIHLQPQVKVGSTPFSPFVISLPAPTKRIAKAYEEIVPGFRFGFDAKRESVVSVSQESTTNQPGAPKGTKYFLRTDIEDPAGSDWVTIERTLNNSDGIDLTCSLTARANELASVDVAVFIPRVGKPDERIPLGRIVVGKEFRSFTFTKSIELKSIDHLDNTRLPRVVVLLPTRSGFVFDLAQFDIAM